MCPEYRTISCELRALAKMVRDKFRKYDSEDVSVANSCGVNSCALFKRGRFYDEYSARRNERLKRKKGVMMVDQGKANPVHGLGVTVESGKKGSSRAPLATKFDKSVVGDKKAGARRVGRKPIHRLGVTVESGKKGSARKFGSLRKSVSAASAEVSETPRYMLRSMTKENNPPLAAKFDKSVVGDKKVGARRVG